MSYQLNKTDGTLLTSLIDGQIDQASTNLTLVGKNYTGYGEAFNENFIKLLENFSNTSAPSNPLTGQLWWDTSNARLKVYTGTQWKASGGPFVQNTQPTMVAGDLWIDNLNNQLYAFDGTDTTLVGPQYTTAQKKSGFEIGTILDNQSRSRTVAYLYIGGTLSAVLSSLEFTPTYSQRVLGLVDASTNPNGIIYEGVNIINNSTFKWHGVANSSLALTDSAGVARTAEQFLASNANDVTTGALTIQNSGGLTIGLSQNNVQKVIGDRFYIENQLLDHDLSLRVRSNQFNSLIVDALYVDASTARVGIFTTNRLPQYTLDVEGDIRATGNLIVQGTQTTLDTVTLRVEDKNIELGYQSDSTGGDDVGADGGGVTLLSTDSNKEIKWLNSTDSWTFNKNIDLSDTTKSIKIGGQTKLTNTSLSNILYADELTRVGTLVNLQVDSININGNTISNSVSNINLTATGGMGITPGGAVTFTGAPQIKGVGDPSDIQDVATKAYTDTEIANEVIVMGFDITGLGTGSTLQAAVAGYLNDLYPASAANSGKQAKLHCTSYANATASGIDVDSAKTISYIAVDSNGTQNESVVQDIVFAGASGNVSLTAARSLMRYQSNGTAWEWQQTTAY
ncbi:MAG: hypothetical protein CMG35_12095 [Candidatus Marinimicrobia bacterium]|jgi:hypothetical protein|nr:hypothetical protein [Candidatus Neomarinimicrobiota bacterium]MBO03373.1 hypothetical protein [Candidatus Neomarinimicrobiota bacterium]|tara:strand:- start:17028 stop:18896 length:1869 start_codon:yes stop_codon:yes gene_type:complete